MNSSCADVCNVTYIRQFREHLPWDAHTHISQDAPCFPRSSTRRCNHLSVVHFREAAVTKKTERQNRPHNYSPKYPPHPKVTLPRARAATRGRLSASFRKPSLGFRARWIFWEMENLLGVDAHGPVIVLIKKQYFEKKQFKTFWRTSWRIYSWYFETVCII